MKNRKITPGAQKFRAGRNKKRKLRAAKKAFTLAETLVVMVISGIVLVSVLDGFMLFEKFRSRISGNMARSSAAMEDYFLLGRLFHSSDSITGSGGNLEFYTKGHKSLTLEIEEPLIILKNAAGKQDTLSVGLTAYRIAYSVNNPGRVDSLLLGVDTVAVSFGARLRAEEKAVMEAERLEKEYAKDEDK